MVNLGQDQVHAQWLLSRDQGKLALSRKKLKVRALWMCYGDCLFLYGNLIIWLFMWDNISVWSFAVIVILLCAFRKVNWIKCKLLCFLEMCFVWKVLICVFSGFLCCLKGRVTMFENLQKFWWNQQDSHSLV